MKIYTEYFFQPSKGWLPGDCILLGLAAPRVRVPADELIIERGNAHRAMERTKGVGGSKTAMAKPKTATTTTETMETIVATKRTATPTTIISNNNNNKNKKINEQPTTTSTTPKNNKKQQERQQQCQKSMTTSTTKRLR